MIRQSFRLDKYDWECTVYYAVTCYYTDEIIDKMMSIGCSGDMLERAYEGMRECELNTGVTYSNFSRRKTVMVISLTSSAMEFEKSWRHEAGHMATHICQALDIDPYGEEIHYIGDAIVGEMWSRAKTLLCDCCRRKIYGRGRQDTGSDR